MKNLILAGLASIALAVVAASQPTSTNPSAPIACGGCTNGVTTATFACGGDCTNKLMACGGDTNKVFACGGCTNSASGGLLALR